ncbi:hypothetical protein Pse7367_3193 [Thalassoporum mexicanum PCC 7367]|uniref:hypothetical protein n=1 Tax=Thalassoporum mexicanum TaxID=3457544 RepID=UPI00029FF03C|nr:hypothetical protein [Pseudanabaena sp. PCC 7367]AFY71441.1 hypothetical protein Pse7367_3193 [Pseudanabaena sp. PCC 7367]
MKNKFHAQSYTSGALDSCTQNYNTKSSKRKDIYCDLIGEKSYGQPWIDSGNAVDVDPEQHAGLIESVVNNWTKNRELTLQLEVDAEWYGERIQPISLQVAEFSPYSQRWQRFYEHPRWSA